MSIKDLSLYFAVNQPYISMELKSTAKKQAHLKNEALKKSNEISKPRKKRKR